MSVIAKISVGDIFYYEVDGTPTHSAPKGSVSIVKSDAGGTTYINNSGTTWLKTIKPAYGEMYISDSTTIKNWNDYTLGSFYSFDGDNTWTSNVLYGFIKGTDVTFGDYIEYTGSTRIRVVIKARRTTSGGSGRWLQFEHTPAYNFTIPASSSSGFHTESGSGTGGSGMVYVQEIVTNDQITLAFSPVTRQGGGSAAQRQFINRHAQLGIYKIDEAVEEVLFQEDWESGDFTNNSWNVVNDSENIWVVGTADNNGGSYSAYISNDGGTSQTYNINNSEISHYYKDFVRVRMRLVQHNMIMVRLLLLVLQQLLLLGQKYQLLKRLLVEMVGLVRMLI
jgi:hypothetical protein